MAGAGAKLFTDGSKLFAAEVNEYLMDQTIMRFADAAARDAAFGGVGEPTLAEGMCCYLMDSNELQKYTGSAWQNVIWNTAWGIISFTERITTSSFAGLTTNITSAPFAVLTGRYYKITYYEPAATISANAFSNTNIFNVTASATINSCSTTQVANYPQRLLCEAVTTFSSGTITLSGRNQSSVGTTNLAGSSTSRAFLLVEDIGPT